MNKRKVSKKKIVNILIIAWYIMMIVMVFYSLFNRVVDLANMYLILMAWLSLYLKDVEL